MNYDQELKILSTYFPFLLVDKILKKTKGDSINVVKNVSGAEIYFQGHFPNQPIMPGVLICELMVQAGHLLLGFEGDSKKPFKVKNFRIRKLICPGDTIKCHIEYMENHKTLIILKGKVTLNDELVSSAQIYYKIIPGF
jgi:3-hydroxyacyl-[acyl-carrier-protein] dehydratase